MNAQVGDDSSWRFGLKTPFLSFVFFFARQHVNTYAK